MKIYRRLGSQQCQHVSILAVGRKSSSPEQRSLVRTKVYEIEREARCEKERLRVLRAACKLRAVLVGVSSLAKNDHSSPVFNTTRNKQKLITWNTPKQVATEWRINDQLVEPRRAHEHIWPRSIEWVNWESCISAANHHILRRQDY